MASWFLQRQEVERLAAAVDVAVDRERAERAELSRWGRAKATRAQPLFWAGVTGFVVVSRYLNRKNQRRPLIVDMGLTAWAVHRWRQLPARIEKRLDQAHAAIRASRRSPQPEATREIA